MHYIYIQYAGIQELIRKGLDMFVMQLPVLMTGAGASASEQHAHSPVEKGKACIHIACFCPAD